MSIVALSPRAAFKWLAAFIAVALIMSGCTLTSAAPSASPAASPPANGSPVLSPTPLPLAPGQTVYVSNTDGLGADIRLLPGPNGAQIRVAPEGAVFTATGRQQEAEGQPWSEVRESTGGTAWIRADFLSTAPPPLPTPTFLPSAASPTPLLIPTFISATPAPAGPEPTFTLLPIAPGRQQGPIAPLPVVATPRPATPTPLRPVRVVPTLLNPDDENGLIRCQDGTVSNSSIGGTCDGHGGVSR